MVLQINMNVSQPGIFCWKKQNQLELIPPTLASELTPPPPKQPRVDDILDFMSDNDNDIPTITAVLAEMNDDPSQSSTDRSSDPLQYCNGQQANLPLLANIAVNYLSVLTSSTPVERLFSVAGRVFHPDKYLLADLTFEKLKFIRCNSTWIHCVHWEHFRRTLVL